MADDLEVAFDKAELSAIYRAFKSMDQAAIDQAKQQSGALTEYLRGKIINTAQGRGQDSKSASRIAEGSRVKKSSKIGELNIGYASQRFSGGGTTQMLWGGNEFGSNKFKQFPVWSGSEGRGSKGWFIYPTLRREQPYIVREWEQAFQKIAGKWDE
jgi:hypothetical protein